MSKKNIPHYINNPTINKQYAPEKDLYRPNINWKKSAVKFISVLTASFLLSLIITEILKQLSTPKTLNSFWKCFWTCEIIICILLLRFLSIFIIRIYQARAKSETRLRCCFVPSCSEYAILCIRRYGFIIGGMKAVRRLQHCHPPGGIEFPYRIRSESLLEDHLRKRIIKKICFERMPSYVEDGFPTLILSGFIKNKDDLNNGRFQISILSGDCRKLKWKKIIANEYFNVIECKQNEVFWSDMITIHLGKGDMTLACPGIDYIFPFSKSDWIDVDSLSKAIIEIIKCSNRWQSHFNNYQLDFDEQAKEKYIKEILKQLRSETNNVYFYN